MNRHALINPDSLIARLQRAFAVLAERRARLAAVFAVGVLASLAAASAANAALSFRFNRATARPGMTVVASEPGWPSTPTGVTVYLVPTRLPGVTPDPAGGYILRRPPMSNVIKLGQPRLTRAHLLTIHFRVPNVRPGNYTTAFWCRTCAKGGDFFASTSWGAPWTGAPGTVLRIRR